MSIAEQAHNSATHTPGNDPACPKCGQQRTVTGIQERLAGFVALCQHVVDQTYGIGDARQTLSIDPAGKKYARIITQGRGSRSVYCFVDLQNGDILKSASWKAPAKGARGNIFADDEGMSRMSAYGAEYNR